MWAIWSDSDIIARQRPANQRVAIAALAQQCLDVKGQGPQVQAWEAEIDERVARLYGLRAADKAIKGE